jgi:heme-degrading monooxygenase HmoA
MAEQPAFARIGFYTAKPGTLDAVIARARTELVPMMQAEPGFRRYTVVRTGPAAIVSLSGWDSREQAQAAATNLSAWVREAMGESVLSMANHIAEVITVTEASTETPVYGRVTDTRFPPGKVEEVRARAQTELLPVLRQQPGFIRHVAFRPAADRAMTFLAFASQAQLEAAEAATQTWREYVASQATSTERHVGEVVWAVRKD